jgi:hypothetical protein
MERLESSPGNERRELLSASTRALQKPSYSDAVIEGDDVKRKDSLMSVIAQSDTSGKLLRSSASIWE